MSRRFSLDQLNIASPCTRDWQTMQPAGDAKRFCDHCTKPVHDISMMKLTEADRLIGESAGQGLCVRMSRDVEGKLITLDYHLPPPPSRWRRYRPVTGALALAGAVCAFFFSSWTIGKPPQAPLLGRIAMPQPPTMGTPAPPLVLMGDVAAPATQPTTAPATQPDDGPHKIGKISFPPTTRPE